MAVGIITIIGTLLTLILSLVKAHADTIASTKQEKLDVANKISNAVASGNIAAINDCVMQLRR